MDSATYHSNCDTKNKIIIMDISNTATNDDIKRVIMMFDVDKDSQEIYRAINKEKKLLLADTAEFLHIDIAGLLKENIVQKNFTTLNYFTGLLL